MPGTYPSGGWVFALTSIADDVWVEPARGIGSRPLAPSREMHWGPSRVEGAAGRVQHVCGEQLVPSLIRVQQHKRGILGSSQGSTEAWDLGILDVVGHGCSRHPSATYCRPSSHHTSRQQEDCIIDGAEEWGYLGKESSASWPINRQGLTALPPSFHWALQILQALDCSHLLLSGSS